MDKTKVGSDQGGDVGKAGVGRVVGGKWKQLYLTNNKKCEKKKNICHYLKNSFC